MTIHRTHSPELKENAATEAISGRTTLLEITADHEVHPIQVSQWKKQLLKGASELPAGEVSKAIEATVQRPRGETGTDG